MGVAVLVGASLCSQLAAGTLASASPIHHQTSVHDPSQFDWPEFHSGPSLNGWASNSPLSADNASGLGVTWSSDLYGAALDSPVVAYDAALQETLAYVGTETGYFYAVNVANGRTVWSDWLGAPVRSTAAVSGNTVYVGTAITPRIYALNATTGSTVCSLLSVNSIEASPVVATPPGGITSVYIGVEDGGSTAGPVVAMNASTCAVEWQFTSYLQESGPWDPLSYTVDATGEPLVMFGTADPDSTAYAIDAVTGKLVWDFSATNPPPGVSDIGTGLVVSPPGANGFADGVVYFTTRYGELYALDLTTGAEIWSYIFDVEPGAGETGISTVALDGTNVVFGLTRGVDDVDAVTGTLIWSSPTPSGCDVDSSPAIAGAASTEVVAFADLCGKFRVVSLATGASLYTYQTGSYVTASPAVSGGNVLIASADGFLYDFGLGGGNESPLPSTVVSSPADGSTVPYPGGPLTIAGTATDSTGLWAVYVAIQSSGSAGPWWDAATASWVAAPVPNQATLASPGALSSSWSITLPVPTAGGTFRAVADAISVTGQSDVRGASSQFSVTYIKTGPHLNLSSSYAAPGATISVRGGGFAKGEHVAISLLGVTLATATASSTNGSFPNTKVKIPSTTAFGTLSLVATGATSGKSTSLPLYVTNSWQQSGDGSTHLGFEGNDAVLRDLVHPGANIFLADAWMVSAGTPVTSPVVLDGVAYVGDGAGQVLAIDTRNGAVLWTWQDASGAAIDDSLAVDPASHLVLAGAADGDLYGLSTANGALAWSMTIGGNVGAPVYGAGTVFATSSSGAVDAVAEATGKLKWSVSLGSAATAPALDTSRKLLLVGDSAGAVVALSTSAGVADWSYALGGTSVTTPLLSGGDVYVGGAGVADALTESSGSLAWSVALSTGDTASATAVNGKTLMVGTTKGQLHFLSLATGAATLKTNYYPQPVLGLAATETVDIVTLSGGAVDLFRSWGNRDFLWSDTVSSGSSTSPVVVNGTLFVGALDGDFYAFTPSGDTPL